MKISPKAERTPCSHVPRHIAVAVLTNPKNKLSGKVRRSFQKSLYNAITRPLTPARSRASVYATRLKSRSLAFLARRKNSLGSYVEHGNKLAAELPHDSIARRLVEDDLQFWTLQLALVNGEIMARAVVKPLRDARPKKVQRRDAK